MPSSAMARMCQYVCSNMSHERLLTEAGAFEDAGLVDEAGILEDDTFAVGAIPRSDKRLASVMPSACCASWNKSER